MSRLLLHTSPVAVPLGREGPAPGTGASTPGSSNGPQAWLLCVSGTVTADHMPRVSLVSVFRAQAVRSAGLAWNPRASTGELWDLGQAHESSSARCPHLEQSCHNSTTTPRAPLRTLGESAGPAAQSSAWQSVFRDKSLWGEAHSSSRTQSFSTFGGWGAARCRAITATLAVPCGGAMWDHGSWTAMWN